MNQGSQRDCTLSIGQNVTINNGAGRGVLVTPAVGPGMMKRVLVTPVGRSVGPGMKQVLATTAMKQVTPAQPRAPQSRPGKNQVLGPSTQSQVPVIVDKIILKAVSQGTKKDSRAYVLRNVETASVCTVDDMKNLIRNQLRREIILEDFNIGYMHGSTVVGIRGRDDISEFWSSMKSSSKTNLWCDGLKVSAPLVSSNKRNLKMADLNSDLDSDLDCETTSSTKKKKKKKKQARISYEEEEVQEVVDNLKEKHGSDFTVMQYRIWGEMVVGGNHKSLDDPPNNTMFSRAGGGTPYKKKNQHSPMTELATAITAALSPKHSPAVGIAGSPAKVIEGRSKLYKQLSELQNLRSSGILSEEEYVTEKESIMDLLKKLKANADAI